MAITRMKDIKNQTLTLILRISSKSPLIGLMLFIRIFTSCTILLTENTGLKK